MDSAYVGRPTRGVLIENLTLGSPVGRMDYRSAATHYFWTTNSPSVRLPDRRLETVTDRTFAPDGICLSVTVAV